MTKLIPSLVPVAVLLASIFAAPVQAYVSAHPVVAVALSAAVSIINHFLPSPAAAK